VLGWLAGWLAWPPLVPLTLPMCCRASGDDSLSLSLLILSPEEIVCCLFLLSCPEGNEIPFYEGFWEEWKINTRMREEGTLSLVHFFHNFFCFFSVTHPTKFGP